MTWYQQLQLLQHMKNAFPGTHVLEIPEEPADDARLRHTFERIESETSGAVDAAVRAFSRSGRIPEMKGAEAYFFVERLDFAVFLTMGLGACRDGEDVSILPDPPLSLQQEDQVEWVLIWAWKMPGRAYWLEKSILNEKVRRNL
jgi:hypothetical protein